MDTHDGSANPDGTEARLDTHDGSANPDGTEAQSDTHDGSGNPDGTEAQSDTHDGSANPDGTEAQSDTHDGSGNPDVTEAQSDTHDGSFDTENNADEGAEQSPSSSSKEGANVLTTPPRNTMLPPFSDMKALTPVVNLAQIADKNAIQEYLSPARFQVNIAMSVREFELHCSPNKLYINKLTTPVSLLEKHGSPLRGCPDVETAEDIDVSDLESQIQQVSLDSTRKSRRGAAGKSASSSSRQQKGKTKAQDTCDDDDDDDDAQMDAQVDADSIFDDEAKSGNYAESDVDSDDVILLDDDELVDGIPEFEQTSVPVKVNRRKKKTTKPSGGRTRRLSTRILERHLTEASDIPPDDTESCDAESIGGSSDKGETQPEDSLEEQLAKLPGIDEPPQPDRDPDMASLSTVSTWQSGSMFLDDLEPFPEGAAKTKRKGNSKRRSVRIARREPVTVAPPVLEPVVADDKSATEKDSRVKEVAGEAKVSTKQKTARSKKQKEDMTDTESLASAASFDSDVIFCGEYPSPETTANEKNKPPAKKSKTRGRKKKKTKPQPTTLKEVEKAPENAAKSDATKMSNEERNLWDDFDVNFCNVGKDQQMTTPKKKKTKTTKRGPSRRVSARIYGVISSPLLELTTNSGHTSKQILPAAVGAAEESSPDGLGEDVRGDRMSLFEALRCSGGDLVKSNSASPAPLNDDVLCGPAVGVSPSELDQDMGTADKRGKTQRWSTKQKTQSAFGLKEKTKQSPFRSKQAKSPFSATSPRYLNHFCSALRIRKRMQGSSFLASPTRPDDRSVESEHRETQNGSDVLQAAADAAGVDCAVNNDKVSNEELPSEGSMQQQISEGPAVPSAKKDTKEATKSRRRRHSSGFLEPRKTMVFNEEVGEDFVSQIDDSAQSQPIVTDDRVGRHGSTHDHRNISDDVVEKCADGSLSQGPEKRSAVVESKRRKNSKKLRRRSSCTFKPVSLEDLAGKDNAAEDGVPNGSSAEVRRKNDIDGTSNNSIPSTDFDTVMPLSLSESERHDNTIAKDAAAAAASNKDPVLECASFPYEEEERNDDFLESMFVDEPVENSRPTRRTSRKSKQNDNATTMEVSSEDKEENMMIHSKEIDDDGSDDEVVLLDIDLGSASEADTDDIEQGIAAAEREETSVRGRLATLKTNVNEANEADERKSSRLSSQKKITETDNFDDAADDFDIVEIENITENCTSKKGTKRARTSQRRKSTGKVQKTASVEDVTAKQKPKRGKKDAVITDEEVEEIYKTRGKSIHPPSEDPSDLLETIFESPVKRHTGTPILLSKRRYRRSQTFPEKPWRPRPGRARAMPRKKKRGGGGGSRGKKTGKSRAMMNSDEEITAHLDEVLANISSDECPASPTEKRSKKKTSTPFPRQQSQSRVVPSP